jgi:hypothetical protein
MNPDPTPFFTDFKDEKKFYFTFFSYNVPTGTSSLDKKLIFLLKFYFAGDIYEKREGSGAGSVPLTNGSGSATLLAWPRRRRGSPAEPVPRGADPSSARPPAFAPQLLGSVCLKKP